LADPLFADVMGLPIVIWVLILFMFAGWGLLALFGYKMRGLPLVFALNESPKTLNITILANGQGDIKKVKHSSLGSDRVRGIGEFVHTAFSIFRVARWNLQLSTARFGMTIPLSVAELADVLMKKGVESMPILHVTDLDVIRNLIDERATKGKIDTTSRDWKRYSNLCNQMWSAKHLESVLTNSDVDLSAGDKVNLKNAIAKFENPKQRASLSESERDILYKAQLYTFQTHVIDVTRLGLFFENYLSADPAMVQQDRIEEEAQNRTKNDAAAMKMFIYGAVLLVASAIVAAVIMRLVA